MQWVKVGAGYYRDPAILKAGEAAEILFIRALGYCREHGTGGFVDETVLPLLVPYRASARALRLVSEGLWTRVEGGYEVRSWGKWQDAGDALEERRRADRERQKRRREAVSGPKPPPDSPPTEPDSHVTESRDTSRDVTALEKSREEKKPPTPNGVGGARKRATRLDPSWTPSQQEIDFALSLGLDPTRVAAVFRDHWLSKSGRDATKVDWTATWRNWCRRDSERHGKPPTNGNRPSTTDQRVQAGLDLARRFAEQEAAAPQLRMIPGRS